MSDSTVSNTHEHVQDYQFRDHLSQTSIFVDYHSSCGLGSVVGIATGYGLDGPGFESQWGQLFPHLSRPALVPTLPPVHWVLGLPGGRVKSGPGRDADPSPPSSAMVKKE